MPLQTHIRSPLFCRTAPIFPLASGEAQEGGTILFFDFLCQAQIAVRSPGSAGADQAPERLKMESSYCHAAVVAAPSMTTPALTYRQKAISSFRANATSALSYAATIELYPVMKPQAQRRLGLMAYPQPSELYHGCSQPRVSSLGDALFVSDRSAPHGVGANPAYEATCRRLEKLRNKPSDHRTPANSGPIPFNLH